MTIPKPLALVSFAIPWFLAIAGFVALVVLRFPPSGTFVASSAMDGKGPWIFPFLPSERVSTPGLQSDGWVGQRITGDPTYATARVPGPYERAVVSLEYRVLRQPLVEFGTVQDASGASLDLKPMYSSQIDPVHWATVNDRSGIVGYVKNGVPSARLEDPDPSGLTVWDTSSTMALLSDPASVATTTRISLRGAHDFYFVPAGGSVHATFSFQFVNRKEGSDTVAFRVYRGDEELPEHAFALHMSNEKRMGDVQTHTVVIPQAAPGTYRVAFLTSDDVFIRSVETTSRHWVLGPRVYFGDTVGFEHEQAPGMVWTNSRHLVAETVHPEGIQILSFADERANVSRTHTAVRMDRTDDASGPAVLFAPKGDVRIILDGFAAFRPDLFFEPKPRRFTDATDVGAEHIQAIRTTYQLPEPLGDGWMRSTFEIPIKPDQDIVRFVLSAPGMASRLGSVDIRNMTITYQRPVGTFDDWLHTLRQEVANAWHRL